MTVQPAKSAKPLPVSTAAKLCSAFLLLAAIAVPASAQNAVQTKQQNEQELLQVQQEIEQAAQRRKQMQAEIDALDQDVSAINRALIETAKRGQELEAEVSRAEASVVSLQKIQASLRKSLLSKRALLSEILAALQRMGRKPPPALLVRPEDALASVRSAIVLGAVVPQIRGESETLLGELQALGETTRKVEEQKLGLADALNALAEDENRLTLLVEQKNKTYKQSQADLEAERAKAETLAARATTLEELVSTLENKIASAAAAAKAARDADLARQRQEAERLASARKQWQSDSGKQKSQQFSTENADPARIEPAIAFSKARGSLPRPVSGVQLYTYGGSEDGRTNSRNIAFATRPNARVRSPADGWVVYAGKFRSYGNLLILNAGQDYHLVLAGMSEINVETGRFVLAGEPVGRMGASRGTGAVTAELGSNKPVLYVEFRKDGTPIDPAPWWRPFPTANVKESALQGAEKGSDDDT